MLSKILNKSFKPLGNQAVRCFSNSPWGHIEQAPADPIFGVNEAFKKDNSSDKVLLSVGAYRTDEGKPYVLECVKLAEQRIVEMGLDHEYAGIDGIASYKDKCAKVAFGADSAVYKEGRIASCQSVSGTGSLRVGLEFLRNWYPNKDAKVFVPNPTWPTHRGISEKAGWQWDTYRYYDNQKRGFDLDGMLEDLTNAPNEQIVLLHGCAHNPTGCDPTQDQWKSILDVMLKKNHFAAFDSAYQGFASGDLDKDAWSLKFFCDNSDRICLFQSFAKNFGLYGERTGCVHFVAADAAEAVRVNSRIKQVARPMYSNPPIHGARIVDIVLGDEKLTKMWHDDLVLMSTRMAEMRAGLVTRLTALGSKHDWSHITSQIGMFAYTGITKDQVDQMAKEHAIYMTADGRISIAGLNSSNLDKVAAAFHAITNGRPLGQ